MPPTRTILADDDPRIAASLIAQAAHPHGDHVLGFGPGSIASGGCIETALCMLARWTGADLGMTPLQVNELGRLHGAFVRADGEPHGNLLLPRVLAPFMGMIAGPKVSTLDDDGDEHTDVDGLVLVLDAVLDGTRQGLLVHVDTDGPLGNPHGNHYVAAVGVDALGRFVCLDPAGGHVVRLDRDDLTCAKPPGRTRPYVARSVRVVSRKAAPVTA